MHEAAGTGALWAIGALLSSTVPKNAPNSNSQYPLDCAHAPEPDEMLTRAGNYNEWLVRQMRHAGCMKSPTFDQVPGRARSGRSRPYAEFPQGMRPGGTAGSGNWRGGAYPSGHWARETRDTQNWRTSTAHWSRCVYTTTRSSTDSSPAWQASTWQDHPSQSPGWQTNAWQQGGAAWR